MLEWYIFGQPADGKLTIKLRKGAGGKLQELREHHTDDAFAKRLKLTSNFNPLRMNRKHAQEYIYVAVGRPWTLGNKDTVRKVERFS